jgi:predicted RNA-binding protein with PIN domain
MPYIVDGHNLIPKISGIQLQDIDDENRLIKKLQAFAIRTHKKIEVFFDQAPPGNARRQSSGLLTVIFVREGNSADQAICRRLKSLKKEARNWTVVSSDHRVQSWARESGAKVLSSTRFAAVMDGSGDVPSGTEKSAERPELEEDDLEYWLNVFRDDH